MSSRLRRASACALLTVAVFAATATSASADRYVALGDSYSSGTGTREYYTTCERSIYSYPYLLSQRRANTQLVFAACGGATTSSVLSSQVSSLTSGTAIVTITVGGNDAGFSSVIVECAKPSWASDCAGRVNTAQSFIRNTLPGRLDQVYSQMNSRSPTAKKIVLGYPRLFAGIDCNAGTWFSSDDMTRLNATADLLRDVTRTRAAAWGFYFKDAIPPFLGHAVCQDEWINGLSNPTSESYHPNRKGHDLGYLPLVRSITG